MIRSVHLPQNNSLSFSIRETNKRNQSPHVKNREKMHKYISLKLDIYITYARFDVEYDSEMIFHFKTIFQKFLLEKLKNIGPPNV